MKNNFLKNLTAVTATILTVVVGGAWAKDVRNNFPPCKGTDVSKWSNCYGTYTYPDGAKYVGEFKAGKWNGQGTYTFANGKSFTGQWANALPITQWSKKKDLSKLTDKDFGFIAAGQLEKVSDAGLEQLSAFLKPNEDINSDLFVIKPQFDDVSAFNEGLARVQLGDKWGFIDKQGNFVINSQFDFVWDFNEGLAAVRVGDNKTGKWGFIDKQGKIVIKPQFDTAFEFNEGLARVQLGDKWGFIDKQGNFVINSQFDFVWDFNEGLAAVQLGDDTSGKWGFIDKQGKFVISPQFRRVLNFSEGLAGVQVGDNKTGKWGFIDKQGKFLINPQFRGVLKFSEGLAAVWAGDNKTGKMGFIDKQGKIVIKPQFHFVFDFKEGLAAVRLGDDTSGKWGFIDKQGKFVIKPQFHFVSDFKEGLAAVRVVDRETGKWGFIDKQGKFVISPQFEDQFNLSYSEGFAGSCYYTDDFLGFPKRKCGFISKEFGQNPNLFSLLQKQKNQEQIEQQSTKLSLQASTTTPDANGTVIITVRTNTDTSSLKINDEEQGGRQDGIYTIKRVARVGQETLFTVSAVDIIGNTDSTTITVARQAVSSSSNQSASLKLENIKRAAPRDAVAIIIGIQNYKRVPKAEYANSDAKEFYEYAIRGLGIKPENIKLLVDEDADEVNIVKAFENWLPLQVNKGKTDVYVFYSGHGLPSADGKSLFFLPHGVDKELLTRTAVGQAEVVSALVASMPKSVTMFIDACYSGQTRGGEVLLASAKPIALKADTNAFPANFTVITASSSDQISSSSPVLKHGIFSFYLMKGMEGDADTNKDGKITTGEMHSYLTENVLRQASLVNRVQQPQLSGDANRVLVGR